MLTTILIVAVIVRHCFAIAVEGFGTTMSAALRV